MITTNVHLHDQLPLTCSRKGTCCYGNVVFLNPWELARIAVEKKMTTSHFVAEFCTSSGIQLRFDGPKNSLSKAACNQYVENFGCSVHLGRPLACRLFPLGRKIQNEHVNYIFEGKTFPCLNECSEVLDLPTVSVQDYLQEQKTALFEIAQDEYLEVMQNLADVALTLLLETELLHDKEFETLKNWRQLGEQTAAALALAIDDEWRNTLLFPEIKMVKEDPIPFIQQHNELLQERAQEKFSALVTTKSFFDASILMMSQTLLLATALGANAKNLVEHWIEIAKSEGAIE
jgi:uncharacterized protein